MYPISPSTNSITSSSLNSTPVLESKKSLQDNLDELDLPILFLTAQKKMNFDFTDDGSNQAILEAMEKSLKSTQCPDAVKQNYFRSYSQCMQSTSDHSLRSTFQLMSSRINDAHIYNGSNFDISGMDLSSLNLSDLNLSHTNSEGANFTGTRLVGTNFYGSNLVNANFSNASLGAVDMNDAQFGHTNFNGADVFNLRTNNPELQARINRIRVENLACSVDDGSSEPVTQYRTIQTARFIFLPQSSCLIL